MNDEGQDNSRSRAIVVAAVLVLLSIVIMVLYGFYVRNNNRPNPSPSPSEVAGETATGAAESDVTVETVSRTPIVDPADPSTTTYSIRYKVKSSESQAEVVIEEEVEANQEYVDGSATPHVATYDSTTRHLQWRLKNVPAGFEGDLSYQVKSQP